LEVVGPKVETGANKEEEYCDDATPLHSAANIGHLKVVKFLVSINKLGVK
jgi:hypothetical protein